VRLGPGQREEIRSTFVIREASELAEPESVALEAHDLGEQVGVTRDPHLHRLLLLVAVRRRLVQLCPLVLRLARRSELAGGGFARA